MEKGCRIMLHILLSGGWVMLPLVLCSIVSVTIIVERFLFFRQMNTVHCADEILSLAAQGQIAKAIECTQKINVPLVKVLQVGLHSNGHSGKIMEMAGISEIAGMKKGLPALDTIITLSPLLGLLGTIVGMISSFQLMAETGLGQPHAVTGGVGEALICTAAGIMVAVLTLVPYNYFLARIERETQVIEEHATRLELILHGTFQE